MADPPAVPAQALPAAGVGHSGPRLAAADGAQLERSRPGCPMPGGSDADRPSVATQEIELILQPFSAISLAKRVIKELAKHGPYKGLLQTGFFDAPEKIKTASIVSFAPCQDLLESAPDRLGSRFGQFNVELVLGQMAEQELAQPRLRHVVEQEVDQNPLGSSVEHARATVRSRPGLRLVLRPPSAERQSGELSRPPCPQSGRADCRRLFGSGRPTVGPRGRHPFGRCRRY